jgi:hypothetical protein
VTTAAATTGLILLALATPASTAPYTTCGTQGRVRVVAVDAVRVAVDVRLWGEWRRAAVRPGVCRR